VTALEFHTARWFPLERVLSVFLRIPMVRSRSRSCTSNEVAPGICCVALESLQFENKEKALRYESNILDDDHSSGMGGSGSGGHPSFNFRVSRVGEQRIHVGGGDDIQRFIALPI